MLLTESICETANLDRDALNDWQGVLPAQFFPRPAGRDPRLEGERRLMAAVLEDAVHCFRKYASASSLRGQRLFRQAERWLMEPDVEAKVSFDYVCDAGGLNADSIRDRLRRWHSEELAQECATGEPPSPGRRRPRLANGTQWFKRASGE